MLFNEVYGSYYRVTAAALRQAVNGTLTPRGLTELVQRQAFSESLLTIPEGLRGERWRLTRRDLTTPIVRPPTRPLTTLQRRWLKALLLDPRIRLFDPDTSGLEDVEPLFTPDMIVCFDRYGDGDDYADPGYNARFRTILKALREGRNLLVCFTPAKTGPVSAVVTPHYLEYSEKDDRFRLIASGRRRGWIVNLARLEHCEIALSDQERLYSTTQPASVTLELVDIRNALERALLHFSHLKKETERLGEDRYRLTLYYDRRDETELVIRVLSFGPALRVVGPDHFVRLVRQRIQRQMAFAPFLPGNKQDDGVESGHHPAERSDEA